ncbi:MAG: hypothetical protein K2X27_21555 [Candidatus Obscuribacterales bacterium]|nr:hypothetical protein [Candidatus Obscuribacterales bacterium]
MSDDEDEQEEEGSSDELSLVRGEVNAARENLSEDTKYYYEARKAGMRDKATAMFLGPQPELFDDGIVRKKKTKGIKKRAQATAQKSPSTAPFQAGVPAVSSPAETVQAVPKKTTSQKAKLSKQIGKPPSGAVSGAATPFSAAPVPPPPMSPMARRMTAERVFPRPVLPASPEAIQALLPSKEASLSQNSGREQSAPSPTPVQPSSAAVGPAGPASLSPAPAKKKSAGLKKAPDMKDIVAPPPMMSGPALDPQARSSGGLNPQSSDAGSANAALSKADFQSTMPANQQGLNPQNTPLPASASEKLTPPEQVQAVKPALPRLPQSKVQKGSIQIPLPSRKKTAEAQLPISEVQQNLEKKAGAQYKKTRLEKPLLVPRAPVVDKSIQAINKALEKALPQAGKKGTLEKPKPSLKKTTAEPRLPGQATKGGRRRALAQKKSNAEMVESVKKRAAEQANRKATAQPERKAAAAHPYALPERKPISQAPARTATFKYPDGSSATAKFDSLDRLREIVTVDGTWKRLGDGWGLFDRANKEIYHLNGRMEISERGDIIARQKDGYVETQYADGTFEKCYPDRRKEAYFLDGQYMTEEANGKRSFFYKDGSEIVFVVSATGGKAALYKGEWQLIRECIDGSTWYTNLNGDTLKEDRNDLSSTVYSVDGSWEQRDRNGKVRINLGGVNLNLSE